MKNIIYHQKISQVTENSLLHLYCNIAASKRFTPRVQRNAILIKWLKPKIKHPAYKPIKNELKRMIMIGREKLGDLERQLEELRLMAALYAENMNDGQKLFDLVNWLYNEHGIESELFGVDEDPAQGNNIVYILSDHIKHCFDDRGQQVAPVSLFIRGDVYLKLPQLVEESGMFSATVSEQCDSQQQIHIQVHPLQPSS
ncbi:DUF2913 family protein [Photobacterium sanctipauli]|uniref:DUF2913 family protein n=1 Tax=Photobacterium sanctipauli TaxID=1342794 RepID=UPI0005669731|nr:DUF2913 family protein [Photobacterium sanctipauli]